MKRWTLLGAVGCLALLAAFIMTGAGRMTPPAAADAGIFSIWGYVWDDTDVDGIRDLGEGAPDADVDLHLCAGDHTWECRDEVGIASTSIRVTDGYYVFPDLWGDDTPYTVCLDITPPTEWTLTMVREWTVNVNAGRVYRRCITTKVGTGAPTLDWGVAHIASELSITKVCDPMSLSEGDIECTITARNDGETILWGASESEGIIVEDWYPCDDFELVSADPEADDSGEDDGYCWFVWYVDELVPGGEATFDITLSPKHTTGTASNCNHGVALNVTIPGGYGAWWEDVYAPDRCVNFGEPERHRRSTSTPVPTATPTEAPPPTATKAPPPVPTATPYGGPAGAGISPPATGTGLASQGVPNVAWWLASFGTLILGLGASVTLAFRKTR